MGSVFYSRIPVGDPELLENIIGYHVRITRPLAVQQQLVEAQIRDDEVVKTLYGTQYLSRRDQATVIAFHQCYANGGVMLAEHEGNFVGYAAYSTRTASDLKIDYRPNDPVALINIFCVPNQQHRQAAVGLIHTLLDELRDTKHFRIAYLLGCTDPKTLCLENLMRPILGFEDYGTANTVRIRTTGLNGADLSMGIARKPGPRSAAFAPREWHI